MEKQNELLEIVKNSKEYKKLKIIELQKILLYLLIIAFFVFNNKKMENKMIINIFIFLIFCFVFYLFYYTYLFFQKAPKKVFSGKIVNIVIDKNKKSNHYQSMLWNNYYIENKQKIINAKSISLDYFEIGDIVIVFQEGFNTYYILQNTLDG